MSVDRLCAYYGFCADLRIMPTSGLRTGQPELREAPKTSA
jgi:hypothetical protein